MARKFQPVVNSRKKSRIVYVSVPNAECELLMADADAATRTLSNQVLHIIRKHYGTIKE